MEAPGQAGSIQGGSRIGLGTDMVSLLNTLGLGVLDTHTPWCLIQHRWSTYLPCTRHLPGAADKAWDRTDKNPCPHRALF